MPLCLPLQNFLIPRLPLSPTQIHWRTQRWWECEGKCKGKCAFHPFYHDVCKFFSVLPFFRGKVFEKNSVKLVEVLLLCLFLHYFAFFPFFAMCSSYSNSWIHPDLNPMLRLLPPPPSPIPLPVDQLHSPFQIYEMILVRHGLMIVGDAIGGKTSAFKVLADSLGELHTNQLMEEFKVTVIKWYVCLRY